MFQNSGEMVPGTLELLPLSENDKIAEISGYLM